MNIGIVGAESAKFTPSGEREARFLIRSILHAALIDASEPVTLVSGGCHLGGIDIWAEEEADILNIGKHIHLPKEQNWSGGYERRNLLIAQDSDIVHNITVASLPMSFTGRRFGICYHCERRKRETGKSYTPHVKSGGCWTAYRAEKIGKQAEWYVVKNVEGE